MNENEIERWLRNARFAEPDPSLRARALHAGAIRSRWPSALSMASLAGVLIAVVATGVGASPNARAPQPASAVEAAASVPTPVETGAPSQPLVARPVSPRRQRLFEESDDEEAFTPTAAAAR